MAITSVGQEYKFTESRHNYKTGTKIIYRDKRTLIEIGKPKDNYNKDRKLRCFNCNIYKHMAKNY